MHQFTFVAIPAAVLLFLLAVWHMPRDTRHAIGGLIFLALIASSVIDGALAFLR